LTYPGGKNGAGVYQKIINQMPPHQVYIEPFLGGAAIMRLKRPAPLNIGIDRDRGALDAAILYSHAGFGAAAPSSLARLPADSPEAASTADVAGSGESRRRTSPLEALPDTIARAGGNRGSSDSTIQASIVRPDDSRSTSSVPWFRFLCGDGIEFLRKYPWTGRELVYCDPPYVKSSRSSARDLYRFEMCDVDHRRLLRVVMEIPCPVLLSGYASLLYGEALKGWRHVTFQAMTRGGRPATEWLWCNFPEPLELHDYRYLGSGFRERERIKRKKQRWARRIERMPNLERQALLLALSETQGKTLFSLCPHPGPSSESSDTTRSAWCPHPGPSSESSDTTRSACPSAAAPSSAFALPRANSEAERNFVTARDNQ
jgi:hypothetical protein